MIATAPHLPPGKLPVPTTSSSPCCPRFAPGPPSHSAGSMPRPVKTRSRKSSPTASAAIRPAGRARPDRSGLSVGIAGFAIKQFRDGRRVGSRLNVRDVMSRHAQRVKGFRVVSLDQKADGEDEVRAALVEDETAGPADTAAARIDVAAWLRRLTSRNRRIARLLATGESSKAAAQRFGLTSARVSQVRQELRRSWLAMQGEWEAA